MAPGSFVCTAPATAQVLVSTVAAAALPAAHSARLAPGLAVSPSALAAGLVYFVSPFGSARSPVPHTALAAAAATTRAGSMVTALPRLVSGKGPPIQQELRQLQFLWLWSGEAAHAHIAQMVTNDLPLLLHLPGGDRQG